MCQMKQNRVLLSTVDRCNKFVLKSGIEGYAILSWIQNFKLEIEDPFLFLSQRSIQCQVVKLLTLLTFASVLVTMANVDKKFLKLFYK